MLRDDYLKCRDALKNGGIENADFEAALMLEALTGLSRASLLAHGENELGGGLNEKLNQMTQKRLERYPLQYLLGKWSFMGFELEVGEGVLIPRDDTEVVTRLCIEYLETLEKPSALELCAGSGAICIALAKLSDASVSAVELSEDAFKFLTKNIELNKADITPLHGDIFSCHTLFEDGSLDLIVSNPPYIKHSELSSLQPEVRLEPKMALDGGESGFDFYEAIVRLWSRKLKKDGALAFELGENQAEYVASLMKAKGFEKIRTHLDFGVVERAIIGIKTN